MKRLDRLEQKLKMAFGERLPDRIEKQDGKLFGFYGNVKQELDEQKISHLLAKEWAKAPTHELVIHEGEAPEDDLIQIGNHKVSSDLKEITLVIDGKKINA